MTDFGTLEYVKLAIYYGSFLYFPVALCCLWLMARKQSALRFQAALLLIFASCPAYARFIEPRMLFTVEHDVRLNACFESAGSARIAVFSDTHNGLFANALSIDRISNRADAANADFVLVAGDFIYFLDPKKFEETFAAFKRIRAPVFAVLGNHDIGLPGPDVSAPLRNALPRAGVRLIDNSALRLSNRKFNIELIALSDQWGGRQNLSLLTAPAASPRFVLTHNPATIDDFRPDMSADLLIGGHTHGGQIQLPFLTCALTGVCGDIAYGLREEKGVQIFTTSGTGMVGLPMRFRVPPRIDVLNVQYEECGENRESDSLRL
ncbi:metallophosphoesterase [Hyphococcus sp.]|uniref:metallophosphoesterase n=1 Tax=Hyphococcus sp. TaxID=2038636 RepID=UPI00208B0D6D|nr:MAG: phosphohydrolase [Marinicaulis sp.]